MEKRCTLRQAIRYALLIGALPASLHASNALAQQPEDEDAAVDEDVRVEQEIVVTGTRLRTPNFLSVSPVTSITAEDIDETGEVKVEDILNRLPQVFAAQGSKISNGSDGTASVDLRGLGPERTLVLVNGRRLMPGDPDGGSAADLNQIPLALVERVEILTGGASSVYGADAVAGVVNFIMNDDLEGVMLEANYGFNQHDNDNPTNNVVADAGFVTAPGDVDVGHTRDFTFAFGVGGSGDPGHATFYATYREVEPVLQSEFDYSACALGSGDTFTCGGSGTTAPAHFQEFVNNVLDSETIVGDDGELRPFADTDVYNFGPLNHFQRPDERYTSGVFANYEVAPTAEVYGELMYMDDVSDAQIAPSGSFFTTQNISCSNPLLSASMVDEWCTSEGLGPTDSATLLVGRRNVEGGGRNDNIGHESFRVVGGIRGDIGTTWRYDAYAQHGSTTRDSTYMNDFSIVRVNRALDIVPDPMTGEAVCQSVLDGTDPNCVPWNIFQPGGVTQASLDYLQTPGVIRAEAIQRIAHVDFTGDLTEWVTLPSAGTGLQLNVGAEYRHEETESIPDLQFRTGDLAGQGGATLPVAGQFHVRELFTEARLPLVEDKPGVRSLAVEAGYRFSDYSTDIETDTFKFGASWAPIDQLSLRSSFQRAVRAPNVGELFSTNTVLLDGTTDPCDGTPSATLEQCMLTGMTAAQYGNVPENPAAQYNGLLGGNTMLDPEKSDTVSFGVLWQPEFADLGVSVDYYDIEIEDRISGVFGGNANAYINQCIATGDPEFCDRINRDAIGSLWLTNQGFVVDTATNTGFLSTNGIDIQTNYGLELPAEHRLEFNLIGTWLDSLETELVEGVGSFDCAGLFGGTCGVPAPEWRHNLQTTWQTPWYGLDFTVGWRYFDAVDLDTSSSDPQLMGPVPATDAHFASRSYFDLTASATFFDNYTLRVGANNVFDKDPPLVGQDNCPAGPCNGNTFAQVYDAIGRQVFATLTVDF